MAQRPTVLDKKDGKFVPPPSPPNQGCEIGAFWLLPCFTLIWGDGGLLFHFILFKIAGAVSRGGWMVMM